ncbi:MAG: menaquinone biosynthetic enzyme MqnA/MqnD family protein [Phycisphaerae bacterium]
MVDDETLEQFESARGSTDQRFRIGSASFLAAKPLLYSLDSDPHVELILRPPNLLRSLLASGEVDVALLPSIDLQHFASPLVVLPAGAISSAGSSLLVRVFARVPPRKIRTLWYDAESHTAIALARVVWAGMFGVRLNAIPLNTRAEPIPADAEAVLLIGDRVVIDPPLGFDRQVDLCSLWKQMTGLPFVFAIWAGRCRCCRCARLYDLLSAAKTRGLANLDEIVANDALDYGWPPDLAGRNLTRDVSYAFCDEHQEGLEEFFHLAAEQKIIERIRPLHFYRP